MVALHSITLSIVIIILMYSVNHKSHKATAIGGAKEASVNQLLDTA